MCGKLAQKDVEHYGFGEAIISSNEDAKGHFHHDESCDEFYL